MKLDLVALLKEGWGRFRRDHAMIVPIAGLLILLPQFAILLLVPDAPQAPAETSEAAVRAYALMLSDWGARYGLWYLAAEAAGMLGTLSVVALYADGTRPTVAAAIGRAAGLFPRFLLATLFVALPIGAGALLLLTAGPVGFLIALPPYAYILARTMLVAPVLIAERPVSAARAIARSWRLTRGHGVPLMGLVATILLGALVIGQAAIGIDQQMRLTGTGGELGVALVDLLASLVAVMSAVTMALLEVTLYRWLGSSNGI